MQKLPPVSPHKIPDEPWVCQWRGCDTYVLFLLFQYQSKSNFRDLKNIFISIRVFESAAAVYSHACNVHCTRVESPCLWAHCDQLPRRRFSLMTHLQDRHCSADVMIVHLLRLCKTML